MTPIDQRSSGAGVAPPGPGQSAYGRSRARRARILRRRMISGAVALFVASWLLIAVVLASGHDPALAARKTAVASPSSGSTLTTTASTPTATTASTPTATTASTPTATTATAPTSAASSGSTSAASASGSTSGSAVTSVTTKQS